MVLTLDRIARKVAQRVGDRNNDRLPEIKDYVEDTVEELMPLFRKGSVYATASVTVTSDEGTLPDDCAAVLKIYDGASTFFEIVDLDTYRSRAERQSTLPTAQVIENVPNWTVRLLNFGSSGTLTVDYLINKRDPGLIPSYYESLIKAGAMYYYALNRKSSDIEYIREVKANYRDKMNQLKENQTYNTGRDSRTKGLPEIELEQANNSLYQSSRNDYISGGGLF